jgi:hypothetical protein
VTSVTSDSVSKALQLWNSDQGTGAGSLLVEQIPVGVRPYWAAKILDLCRPLTHCPLEVHAVHVIASHRPLWRWGHVAFGFVRRLTVRYENAKGTDEVYGGLLYLAENVAKVTYNATDPPDPFDDDAAAWVVACLRDLVNKVNRPEFEAKAWSLASQ